MTGDRDERIVPDEGEFPLIPVRPMPPWLEELVRPALEALGRGERVRLPESGAGFSPQAAEVVRRLRGGALEETHGDG